MFESIVGGLCIPNSNWQDKIIVMSACHLMAQAIKANGDWRRSGFEAFGDATGRLPALADFDLVARKLNAGEVAGAGLSCLSAEDKILVCCSLRIMSHIRTVNPRWITDTGYFQMLDVPVPSAVGIRNLATRLRLDVATEVT